MLHTPDINQEIKNRIKLSIAAYAYEYKSDPIMSDDEFDQLALKINPEEKTGNIKLDNFFRKHFATDTGLWVRKHPELNKLEWLYNEYFKNSDKNVTVQ
tara:strand:- start:2280 stop:2576 length:297 start_codon:yes stop_codon:yes gene_type:complete